MTDDDRNVEPNATGSEDDDLRRIYGAHARVSRSGKFTLVHLDRPSDEEIRKRTDEFDPADFFFDDCGLCRIAREQGGTIIFDERADARVFEENTVRTSPEPREDDHVSDPAAG